MFYSLVIIYVSVASPTGETVRLICIARDPVFANALLYHPQEMISCMAAFQVTPAFMSQYVQTYFEDLGWPALTMFSYVHKFLTKGGRSQSVILAKLADIMGAGRDAWDEQPDLKKLTLAWNMVELTEDSRYWQGPEHLAQSLLGIWFAAAHQPWMFLDFIMLTLAVRPDLQDDIRREIRGSEPLDYSGIHSLPFLDSFIKEVVRLHPLDTSKSRISSTRPVGYS